MKSWFPFTDHDFYAYIASGSMLIAVADLCFNGARIVGRPSWTVVAIIIFVAAAYIVGHVVAALSAITIEHWLARSILSPPPEILLRRKQPNRVEQLVDRMVGWHYKPMTAALVQRIEENIARVLSPHCATLPGIAPPPDHAKPLDVSTLPAEDIFRIADRLAQFSDPIRERLDNFRNQYGFCRNIAFVGFVSAALFVIAGFGMRSSLLGWAMVSFSVAVLMTIRFLKFYATYTAEALDAVLVARYGEDRSGGATR